MTSWGRFFGIEAVRHQSEMARLVIEPSSFFQPGTMAPRWSSAFSTPYCWTVNSARSIHQTLITSEPDCQRWMVVPMSMASAPGGPNLMISR